MTTFTDFVIGIFGNLTASQIEKVLTKPEIAVNEPICIVSKPRKNIFIAACYKTT